jgi:molybdenum cofactor guanylyltransferase
MAMDDTNPALVPELHGLVLAGGEGRRMGGRDKGAIHYGCEPQARAAHRLLRRWCVEAFVAVRAEQAGAAPYADLPLLLDDPDGQRGPAAGLLSAWRSRPGAAWLVLATDLPLVDGAMLEVLVRGRNAAKLATAYRHPDGTLEPLCAIWEPAARAPLLARIESGDGSLRRLLEQADIEALEPTNPERLTNVNSLEDLSAVRRRR